ncbi:MAG: N-acetyltransferase [Actinobacteria bacterium]|nr:N-acetyltransferase [Actinomycetota bacterium]
MLLRRERPDDADAIRNVQRAAFADPERDHGRLVDDLRADGDIVPGLSLVAELDGEIAGHVVCSRATVDGRACLALGPIGVVPSHQRSGIGSALMHAVIAAADALDEPAIVLLGHPSYYPRFGFEPAADHGVTPPEDWGRDVFMVRRLSAWAGTLRGTFRYAPAFERM